MTQLKVHYETCSIQLHSQSVEQKFHIGIGRSDHLCKGQMGLIYLYIYKAARIAQIDRRFQDRRNMQQRGSIARLVAIVLRDILLQGTRNGHDRYRIVVLRIRCCENHLLIRQSHTLHRQQRRGILRRKEHLGHQHALGGQHLDLHPLLQGLLLRMGSLGDRLLYSLFFGHQTARCLPTIGFTPCGSMRCPLDRKRVSIQRELNGHLFIRIQRISPPSYQPRCYRPPSNQT